MAGERYNYADIVHAYGQIGLAPGDTVLVRGNFGNLFAYEDPRPERVLDAHYRALRELIGETGTVVVPTNSFNLCNTDIPFSPANTPSYRRGQFSEFVRKMAGAHRSFHPFVSYAAIGARAAEITDNVSRHGYGPLSCKDRLIGVNAWCLSVGLPPNLTCSVVHHVEHVMAVPYRYTKEFLHPVERNGEIRVEPFYLHVWYRDCVLKRNRNVKIVEAFRRDYPLREVPLGHGLVHGYRLAQFYESACRSFCDDIYIWLDEPPAARPYQR